MAAVAQGGRGEDTPRVKRLNKTGEGILALEWLLDVASTYACGQREVDKSYDRTRIFDELPPQASINQPSLGLHIV